MSRAILLPISIIKNIATPFPCAADKNSSRVPFRAPADKEISSRVPRYQNSRKAGGFCSFSVKSPNIGGDLVGVDVSLLLSLRQRK